MRLCWKHSIPMRAGSQGCSTDVFWKIIVNIKIEMLITRPADNKIRPHHKSGAFGLMHQLRNCWEHPARRSKHFLLAVLLDEFPRLLSDVQQALYDAGYLPQLDNRTWTEFCYHSGLWSSSSPNICIDTWSSSSDYMILSDGLHCTSA